MENTSSILTVKEVADILRCSKVHVHNAIHGKAHGLPKLTHQTMGRRKLVRRDWLEKLLELFGVNYFFAVGFLIVAEHWNRTKPDSMADRHHWNAQSEVGDLTKRSRFAGYCLPSWPVSYNRGMTVPIDQVVQHVVNAIPPINITVQQPAGIPEWIKTLLSALGGLIVGLLMEFVKPTLEKRRKKKSVERNLAKEVNANLRVMEACKLILEEGEPITADASTKVAVYIRHIMGALSVNRFDHYRKQDPVLIADHDPELILNGFMQSIRVLTPMVLNRVHPQFKDILQNSIRAGHAYLEKRGVKFDPNGYPLNEVEPLLAETRKLRESAQLIIPEQLEEN